MAMATKVAPSGQESIRVKERDSNLADPKEQQTKIKWVKENSKMKNWLEKNIRLRKCSYYIPYVKNICHCGYSKEMHTNNVQIQHKLRSTTKSEWKYENDVYTETTNAFGDIKLDEFGRNVAKVGKRSMNLEFQKGRGKVKDCCDKPGNNKIIVKSQTKFRDFCAFSRESSNMDVCLGGVDSQGSGRSPNGL